MFFDRLAKAIIKHPKQIILAWVIILLCSLPLAAGAGDVLKYDTAEVAMKDSESVQGMGIIEEYFHHSETSVTSSPILVLKSSEPSSEAESHFRKLVEGYLNDPSRLSEYKDGNGDPKITNFAYSGVAPGGTDKSVAMVSVMYSPGVNDDTSELRKYISDAMSDYRNDTVSSGDDPISISTFVTGTAAIAYDAEKGATGDLSKIEPFTIILILLLVGLFFRSLISAATPPITIGFAFGITLAIMFGLGQIMNIFFITQMLILVTMMGAGCDYCIFILARYREERRNGASHEKSLYNSIVWAGESIAISGAVVMIGFGSISLCTVPMVSTMGIVMAIGILVALLAALTLITSLLSVLGDKMFWPSKAGTSREGNKATKKTPGRMSRFGARYFHKSAVFSQKHAKAIVVAAILVTVPAAYVAATSETSYDFMGTISTGESYEGLKEVEGYVGGGFLMPNQIVIEYDDPVAILTYAGSTPMLNWTSEDRYGKAVSLTEGIGSIDNVQSSVSIMKWYVSGDNEGILAEAIDQATVLVDPLNMLLYGETVEVKESIFAHAIAGIALMKMPTGAIPYATVALTGMGMDPDLLKIMFALSTTETITPESLAPLFEYIGGHASMPGLTLAAMKADETAPVMDAMINYMGGALGGTVTAGVGGYLTHVNITAITESSATSPESMDTIKTISSMVDDFKAANPEIVNSWVTGSPAVTYDLSNSVGEEFKYIILILIVLILLLLFFVMKSYTIPLRSVLTIVMSIVWTLALTHLVFTEILGVGVVWLVPLILFVVCLGLGMDYDIFLTTRIKENAVHRKMDNDTAIQEAVIHTGSVITICGLIMGGAFGTLMLSSMPMMQEFGFALCFAILVDALIVRTYIVPAVMHLLGKWNWVGPKWLQKTATAKE